MIKRALHFPPRLPRDFHKTINISRKGKHLSSIRIAARTLYSLRDSIYMLNFRSSVVLVGFYIVNNDRGELSREIKAKIYSF